MLRLVLPLTLAFLMPLCAACGPVRVQDRVTVRDIRVPAHLLTPLEMPVLEPPVTVKSLLVHCHELEDVIAKANDRFEEIRKLQD